MSPKGTGGSSRFKNNEDKSEQEMALKANTEVKDLRLSNDMAADNNKKLTDVKRDHGKTFSEGKRVTLDLQD